MVDAVLSAPKARSYALAWAMALIFYVLEYATRSAPAVMIPQLSAAFTQTALGVSAILGAYYYTYSVTSLIAGVILDRAGAKYAVSFGVMLLGLGCLVFTIASPIEGYIGRLMQGAGSSFAFTGAVYLASHAFPPRSLATAIGVTQCLGMLGGSAGQFLVGPLLEAGITWESVWIFFGVVGLLLAVLLILITPASDPSTEAESNASAAGLLDPYKVVLANPQSYLCGLIAGLMFVPTTIGDMTWGATFFQHDLQLDYKHAVTVISMVPLGWVVGCPLMGWLADWIGLRKPVLIGGGIVMLVTIAQIALMPHLVSPLIGMFVFGVASGAAMIPYTIIKEANPDRVKGSATGTINFLNFGISALVGPIFGAVFGRTFETAADPIGHFRHAGLFWMAAVLLSILLSLLLKETGHRHTSLDQTRA